MFMISLLESDAETALGSQEVAQFPSLSGQQH